MPYRLGVDVGGTFTDLLLIDEKTGQTSMAKVPSTPADQSKGVLIGIERVCAAAGIDANEITHVMHGTTVATNAILVLGGAKVGLVTSKGYGQVLQIARSFVPGGLGGWIIYNKSIPLAPLELTIEADERMSAKGEVVRRLDEGDLVRKLEKLKKKGIESLTISLVNAYVNGENERKVRDVARRVLPDIPISISSEVIPEMQEYERTITTVANSYVAPVVRRYVRNLHGELSRKAKNVQLHILRSDGGLASVDASANYPVNLLMSGPAGGVAGAIWIAKQSGFKNLLTFDMGGTSTDVCLVQKGVAQLRRETTVGDVTVRASSVDVRSVGAGGGSIAHVPELTKALRVGPQSAGADPGPAAYGKGGEQPTVTDANMVIGVIPDVQRLGGEMPLDRKKSEVAVQKIADALGLPLMKAAQGIIDIVNENMFGALRLVSVQQGFDPRDFALVAFGGAGPMHANALGKLINSWPVIVPPSPGVLCAYGDATTRLRDEASQTFIRKFPDTTNGEVQKILERLQERAAKALDAENVPRKDQSSSYQIDIRYSGQGLVLTIDIADLKDFKKNGLETIAKKFDAIHTQMFTFALTLPHELVNLRAVVQGKAASVKAITVGKGSKDPKAAKIGSQKLYADGKIVNATVYDRKRLKAGNRVVGPAIVLEMDSTTLILPKHYGEVDRVGSILIRPLN
ncbi:MAG: hydantoinase/oxoprolinase family protein [Alphaproteobacteria bacterium]|nr:hydantoinase/oxoprolinase family protein [Alphaproteobacteria bacterium]